MKVKNILLALAAVSLALTGSGAGLIAAEARTSVTNNFETGVVDIGIAEYQRVGDIESAWIDNPTVIPNQTVSKIPRITAYGNKCYVRAKITIRENEEITEDCIYGFGKDWVRAEDGYWYCTTPLNTGEYSDLFQGVHIPYNLSQDYEGKVFYIDITSEAVQYLNFTPDFNAPDPWGDLTIQEFDGRAYDVASLKEADNLTFAVDYIGKSKDLIAEPEDFFSNFRYLMPGDIFTDEAKVTNDSDKAIKLYFSSEHIDDSVLLEKLQLSIKIKDGEEVKEIYSGNIDAKALNEGILLHEIPAGKSVSFIYEITVPAELDNEYEVLKSRIKWNFWCDEIEPITPDDGGKTGDKTPIGMYVLTAGISMAVLTLGVAIFVRDKKEEEEET